MLWCDQETAMFLSQPLPSTRLPPHYYVTCDKATPSRMTSQAVMLCLMIGGQRQAVAVKAGKVITPRMSLKLAAWMGTACDGPYQAKLFGLTLQELLD